MTEPLKGQDIVSASLGKTKEEATKFIEGNGYHVRVMGEDGEMYIGTCDYNTGRVNLYLNKGKVTKADIG